MKVLVIASNADSQPNSRRNLRIEQEITDLQRISLPNTDRKIDFQFLPALPFEELEMQLVHHKPDVVHLIAHGSNEEVYLSDSYGEEVPLNIETLRSLLAVAPPKLVYINACNSTELAQAITDTVPFAVGTTAEINNFAARKGSVSFYRALSQGRTIQSAFSSCESMVKAMDKDVAVKLHFSKTASPDEVLFEPTRIVARFVNDKFNFGEGEDSTVDVEIGVAGAPDSTVQLVLVSDEETFLTDRTEFDPIEYLASTALTTVRRGEIWLYEPWTELWGDVRLYALLITAGGKHMSVGGTLCEALENFYKIRFDSDDMSKFPADLAKLIKLLKDNDGSCMRPHVSKLKTRPKLNRKSGKA